MRILVVEDEPHLQKAIKLNFELEGYEVATVDNGLSALDQIKNGQMDLVVLDVMLPEMDGFTVCEKMRDQGDQTPILFLTAKNTSADRIKGLRIGGDDFLAKPFDLEELLLRVRNLLSKQPKQQTRIERIELPNGTADLKRFVALDRHGNEQNLGRKEVGLLRMLAENEGVVVTREEILERVWGKEVFPSPRTVDNYITTFRKLFELDPKMPQHFHSVRGVGYKFTS